VIRRPDLLIIPSYLRLPAPRNPNLLLPINTTIPPSLLLRHNKQPSYTTPPCEAPMPFTIRSYRRFPVLFPVTYHAGLPPPPL
jgi:hypothetical protein